VPDLRGFARRAEKVDTVNARIAALQRKLSDADDKFKRLYKLIGDGVTETDDVLKDRLNVLTEAAPEDAPGLVIRDAVEANFRAGRITLSICHPARFEACPSASAGTRSRSGRSMLSRSAGGLSVKGAAPEAVLCFMATSCEW
jgi:hypothetical protein